MNIASVIVFVAITFVARAARAQDLPPEFHAFLAEIVGLSQADIRAATAGEPVTHVLPSRESRDVAMFGMIAVKAPVATVGAFLSAMPGALNAPGRTIGILRETATPADFEGVTMSEENARALRACRIGACEFKLSTEEMARAAAVVAREDEARAATLFEQERLAAIVNAYRRTGNAAMPEYNDYGKRTIAGADAFNALVADEILFRFAPGLQEYLTGYPRAELPGSRDVLYWSIDQLPGAKATTSLNHRVMYSPADAGTFVSATKEIAADHYLESGLDVVVVVEKPGSNHAESYVMFLRQYRFDHMAKVFFVSLRGRVVAKLRELSVADLQRLRSEAAK